MDVLWGEEGVGSNFINGAFSLLATASLLLVMLKTSKRKNQLMDARASKHMKMGEPEVGIRSYSRN